MKLRRRTRTPRLPALDRGAGPTRQERNPDPARPLPDFRFFAIVKTWMDEEIIEATVRNAFVQGVETVFVVDNGSTDTTVQQAVRAGATVAEVYETETFNGRIAQALINGIVARESLRTRAEHVWWLHLDSDEFPEGPGGLTLRDYLASLDQKFHIVGSRFVNHLPHGEPAYVPGFHPIDFQPLCYEFDDGRSVCGRPHWKHPLQRFDRNGQFMRCREGAHFAFGRAAAVEPALDVVTHHFQFRTEESTRARLAAAHERAHSERADNAFERRIESVDAVYEGRWHRVSPSIPTPEPWADMAHVRRWYDPGMVTEESRARRTG